MNTKEKIILTSLLVVVVILFTTYYKYPWHPDHYSLGQYTYAMIEKGYAPWVLHPISLFGYYPLSVPSGFEFFFSALYSLSNLDLPALFYMFSIFSALFMVAGVYLIMREFSSFETSFITAFVLATTVYFVKNVSNTASSRIFNMMFYPLFILVLFRIYNVYKGEHRLSSRYTFTAIGLFVLMNLIHRFGQLLVIFIGSFILAIVFAEFSNILSWLKKTKIYAIRKKAYDHSILAAYIDVVLILVLGASFSLIKNIKIWFVFALISLVYYILFDFILISKRSEKMILYDIFQFIILGIGAKAFDLLIRGRLLLNLSRLLEKYSFQLSMLGIVVAITILTSTILIIKKFKNMRNFFTYINKSVDNVKKRPHLIVSLVLLIITLFFISKNFTGDNFYRFGLTHYTDSFILKGNSPWVIMVNFIFNLNNNLTILIYFAGIGALYLFLKKNKSFYDYFFVFVAMGFSQFLLDWEYIRLYMIPLYVIFIGIGLTFVIKKLSTKLSKKILFISIITLFIAHIVIGNFFIQRERIMEDFDIVQYGTIDEPYFISAGNYLKDKGEVSIHTSSSIEYDRKTAYYANKVISVLAESTLINKDLEVEEVPLGEIIDSFKRGQKIRQFYILKDPLFGSNYYHGRYIVYLNGREITDRTVKKIIDLYNINYVVDSPDSKEKTKLFESIEPLKNKVYSSGELDVYDLSEGR